MSSQSVTIPCSIGYFNVKTPFFDLASYPTYAYFWFIPTMTLSYFGLPTIDAKDVLGASSPDKPALHIPDPLSITTGVPF